MAPYDTAKLVSKRGRQAGFVGKATAGHDALARDHLSAREVGLRERLLIEIGRFPAADRSRIDVEAQARRPVRSRAMIVFMISDVPPKIVVTSIAPTSTLASTSASHPFAAALGGTVDRRVAGRSSHRPTRT